MKRRLVILTEIIAPYRIPVFNALASRGDVDLHVIFFSENDPTLRQWHVYKEEIKFSYEVLPSWRRRVGKYNLLLNSRVGASLRRANPDAILCGGYSYLASWQAAMWAQRHAVPLLLWSESTKHDQRRRHAPVEFMKLRFRRLCRAFVAAGKSSREYLLALGAPESSVFIAPDAVDVQFYTDQAEKARQHVDQIRARHDLPSRYFLFTGRLVKEKGVFDLLSAYSTLDENTRSQIGLVFAGDGPVRSELVRQAAEIRPGVVKFCGWVHREQIPGIYALAEALIFPTHTDPWGLVVNEAMACGLPIIASEVAGCVPDLVEDGCNGFVVAPRSVESLARAMQTLVRQPELAAQMGSRSRQRIRAFTPEKWVDGLLKAVVFAVDGSVAVATGTRK
jgi:glycosyltransferase involved in cell wall biosynthesis